MRQVILDYFNRHKKRSHTIKQITHDLNLQDSDAFKRAIKAINDLTEETVLVQNPDDTYSLLERSFYVRGRLDLKGRGFGFLMPEDPERDDIYIPEGKTMDAMHLDTCLVYAHKPGRSNRQEGYVVRILKRHKTHLIGLYKAHKQGAMLEPEDDKISKPVFLKEVPKTIAEGDLVYAAITNFGYRQRIEARIEKVLGRKDDKGNDVLAKVLSHNIDPVFPPYVIEEAKAKKPVSEADLKDRIDVRDRLIMTIDGDDAKDFDDAIDIASLDDHRVRLAVHIADVSHYVSENSQLDREAYHRGTSVYLPGSVIPMLPEHLSNDLCSLNPGVDRLAITCEMTLNGEGKVLKHKLYPSVIQSKQRFTYTRVNALLDGAQPEGSEGQMMPSLKTLYALTQTLNQRRMRLGSIDFDTEEAEVILNDEGQAIDIQARVRGKSERMIEECMLLANQVVARAIFKQNYPFVYRVHDAPKEEKLERFLTVARTLGYTVKGDKTITHQALQKLITQWRDDAAKSGLTMLMLRSMQKAIYTTDKTSHFGLAFDYYTHFTSPIRRYPDLIVHRLIRTYVFEKRTDQRTLENYRNRLPRIAEQSSEKERQAIECERDVVAMKKAEVMEQYVGETFEGIITSVTPFGLYVTLPNSAEGLLHISNLGDERYQFDDALMMLRSPDHQTRYRLGEGLRVKLMGVNIKEGQLDFTLAGGDHESHRAQ